MGYRRALATALCASTLLVGCYSSRAYVYDCRPGFEPRYSNDDEPDKYSGPHGRWQRFARLLNRACTASPDWTPSDQLTQRFGRFLPAGEVPDNEEEHLSKLRELAGKMCESADQSDPNIPAGMIFLGQFIDHDITLDVMSQLGERFRPSDVENVRTPRLDLDSVYLDGPEASPYLYGDHALLTDNDKDFRRVDTGSGKVALIGDPRNDENGLIAQLHLLFLRYHNKVLADVAGGDFEKARRHVRWHYQWIVRHEFLPAIVDDDALAWAEEQCRADWHQSAGAWLWGGNRIPDMPVEFAAAAYRFGHSQIRSKYDFGGGRMVDLFQPPALPGSLSSFEPVPMPNVVGNWGLFFDGATPAPNRANPIDTKIAKEVYKLPFAPADSDDAILPLRNLIRGDLTFVLPSGEAAAAYLGVPALPEDAPAIRIARDCKLTETPLWYYVLAEAEENGGKLGAVGGRIVALTLLRMLVKDPESYLNAEQPWQPAGGSFTMADLAAFVGS